MFRFTGLIFAIAGFVLVHLVFAYAVFWLAGFPFERTISSPARMSAISATILNLGLIALFGFQHSGMARKAFKRATARFVASGLERAVYVWCAVIALFILVHFFQPIPVTLWRFENIGVVTIIWILFVAGWSISAAAYLSAGIFYLLGVSQALAWFKGEPHPAAPLVEGYAYKVVRNPQQLGLLIAFWSTPHMTLGHGIFAAGLSAYILLGMRCEERDLTETHGETYKALQSKGSVDYSAALCPEPSSMSGTSEITKRN